MRSEASDSDWAALNAALERLLDAPEAQWPQLLEALPAPLRIRAVAALDAMRDDGLDALLLERAAASPTTGTPESLIGQVIGGFRLSRVLGTGGMSWVFEAERVQGGAIQRVALKRLRPGSLAEPVRQRFRTEQQLVGRLQHPGIARLVAAGLDDEGMPWLATELVDGMPLTVWCDQRCAPLTVRLQVFVKVCEAVAAAHRHLIVHRDLKPANVLVDPAGQPKLLDFGISRLIDPEQAATRAEWRMLTPEYAAPEQLAGAPATTAMDVYALGVVLHELLAGRRPLAAHYRSSDTAPLTLPSLALTSETARQRGGSAAVLRRRLRGDLDAIVLRALEFDPQRRYPSVEALAADVQASLEKRPVAALRHRRLHSTWRFVQRNRAASWLGVLLLGSLVAGGVTIAREHAQRQRALQRAEAVEEFLLGLFRSAHLSSEHAAQQPVAELLAAGALQARDGLARNPALGARLLQVIATAQDQLDQFDASLANYSGARNAATAAGDRLLVAEVDAARAGLMLRSGRDTTNSERKLRDAVASLRRHGRDDGTLAMALGVLARYEKDWHLSEAHLREAIARMDAHDPLSSGAVELRSDLGTVYELNGQPEAAVAMSREAFELAERVLGEGHLVTLRIGFNLGKALRRGGEWSAGYALMERTSRGLGRLLPAAHTDQIAWRVELAGAAALLDRLDQADRLIAQAIRLADSRPDTPPMLAAVLRSHRGHLRERQGRTPEALIDIDQAYEQLEAAGAAGHFQGCWAQNASARLLFDLGRNEEAELRLAEPSGCGAALDEARARAAWARADRSAAQDAYARLLEPAESPTGPAPSLLRERLRYAILLAADGRSDSARLQLEWIVDRCREAGIEANPELRGAKSLLASLP